MPLHCELDLLSSGTYCTDDVHGKMLGVLRWLTIFMFQHLVAILVYFAFACLFERTLDCSAPTHSLAVLKRSNVCCRVTRLFALFETQNDIRVLACPRVNSASTDAVSPVRRVFTTCSWDVQGALDRLASALLGVWPRNKSGDKQWYQCPDSSKAMT